MARLLDLCDRLGIDPIHAVEDKMVKNAVKYPVQGSNEISTD